MASLNNMPTFHKRFTCLDFEIFLTLKKNAPFPPKPTGNFSYELYLPSENLPYESNLLIALRNFCSSASYPQKIFPSFVQPSKAFAFQLPLLRKSALQSFNLQKFHFLYTQRFFLLRKFRHLGDVYIKWNGNYLINYISTRESSLYWPWVGPGMIVLFFFPVAHPNSEGFSSIRYVPCRIEI